MDKISVTDAALQVSRNALQNLMDTVANATTSCKATLSSNISYVDDNFKKAIAEFVELSEELNAKLSDFARENIAALNERLNKIQNYENQRYIKQNIV